MRGIGNLATAVDHDTSIQPLQAEIHDTIRQFVNRPHPAANAAADHSEYQHHLTSIRSQDDAAITSVLDSVMRI